MADTNTLQVLKLQVLLDSQSDILSWSVDDSIVQNVSLLSLSLLLLSLLMSLLLYYSHYYNYDVKHSGSWTGVYWRGDPNTGARPPSNDNWPRNGSLLKGYGPFVVKGEEWFKVIEIQQTGTNGFKPVPEGTW